MDWAIQYTDTAHTFPDAVEVLLSLRSQEGIMGARILPPNLDSGTDWRLQAIFEDGSAGCNGWLPGGCRRVMLPESFKRNMANW